MSVFFLTTVLSLVLYQPICGNDDCRELNRYYSFLEVVWSSGE